MAFSETVLAPVTGADDATGDDDDAVGGGGDDDDDDDDVGAESGVVSDAADCE